MSDIDGDDDQGDATRDRFGATGEGEDMHGGGLGGDTDGDAEGWGADGWGDEASGDDTGDDTGLDPGYEGTEGGPSDPDVRNVRPSDDPGGGLMGDVEGREGAEGDGPEGQEGAEGEEGEINPWANAAGEIEGDELGWDASDEGQEEGEDPQSEKADDPQEQGPPNQDKPGGGRPSRARRVFSAAKRAHGIARQLMPHSIAKRLGRRFGVFGDGAEGACCGIGDDPAGECGDEMTLDLYKTGRGWSGVVRIPTGQGRALMMASSPSPSQGAALNKAANLTKLAAGNPMLSAMVPPQAKLAMMAMQHPLAKKALGKVFRR